MRLDAVKKAKQAYVMAKSTLEARLYEQLRNEMLNLQTQIDIAVRYAYDSGESKADILRSLGTKDYGTLNASLERTQAVTEVVGRDPLDSVYSLLGDDVVSVTYVNHGVNNYSGHASFDVKKLDDGSFLFLSRDKLWSDDYKVRNDVVAALDGRTDGAYYEELSTWISTKF
jgi:hypothetical protein